MKHTNFNPIGFYPKWKDPDRKRQCYLGKNNWLFFFSLIFLLNCLAIDSFAKESNTKSDCEDEKHTSIKSEKTFTKFNFERSRTSLLSGTGSLACNSHVYISLSNQCVAKILPDMILEGFNPGSEKDFIVNILDGPNAGKDTVTLADLNKKLRVEVIDTTSSPQNKCWGYVTVEDKIAPILTCKDTVIMCGDVTDLDNIISPTPTLSNDCSGDVTFRHNGGIRTSFGCLTGTGSGIALDTVSRILRTWVGTDASGNSDTCTQTIHVVKPPVNRDSIIWPKDIIISCDNPDISPAKAGFPKIKFNGDTFNISSPLCFVVGNFVDQDFNVNSCAGSKHILRTWTIIDWCRPNLVFTNAFTPGPQAIEIKDTIPPLYDTIRLSDFKILATNGHKCMTDVKPAIPVKMRDVCSGAKFRIIGPTKTIVNDTADFFPNVPAGEHKFIYIISDSCGNEVSDTLTYKVWDNTIPLAIAQELVVNLVDGNGTTWLPATALDGGSTDNCGMIDSILIKKPGVDTFSTKIALGCDDLGMLVLTLRVVDKHGNAAEVSKTILITDKNGFCTNECNPTLKVDTAKVIQETICGKKEGIIEINNGDNTALEYSIDSINYQSSRIFTNLDTGNYYIYIREKAKPTCTVAYVKNPFRLDCFECDPTLKVDTAKIIQSTTICGKKDGIIEINNADNAALEYSIDSINYQSSRTFTNLDTGNYYIYIREKAKPTCTVAYVKNPLRLDCFECDPTLKADTAKIIQSTTICGKKDGIIEINNADNAAFEYSIDSINYQSSRTFTNLDTGNYYIYIREKAHPVCVVSYVKNPLRLDCFECDPTVKVDTAKVIQTTMCGKKEGVIEINNADNAALEYSIDSINYQSSRTFTNLDTGNYYIYIREKAHPVCVVSYVKNPLRLDCFECDPTLKVDTAKIIQETVCGQKDGIIEINNVDNAALEYSIDSINYQSSRTFTNLDSGNYYIYIREKAHPTCTVSYVKNPLRLDCIECATNVAINSILNSTPSGCDVKDGTLTINYTGTNLEYSLDSGATYTPLTVNPQVITGLDTSLIYLFIREVGKPLCPIVPYGFNPINMYGACISFGPGNPTASMAGHIQNENGEMVEAVTIDIGGYEMAPEVTGANGTFMFEKIPLEGDYSIRPEKDRDHANGITTFDIVLLSKHILGLKYLDSPYKMIAADINHSGAITAYDMVLLRQVILGMKNDFPNNKSWRFIDANYKFLHPDNPFIEKYPEVYEIKDLAGDMMTLDFIAVKIGDLNNTASVNQFSKAESRNSEQALNFRIKEQYKKKGEMVTVDFKVSNFQSILGYQFTLDFDINELEFEQIITGDKIGSENFNLAMVQRGLIATSWSQAQPISIDPEEVLFSLVFRAKEKLTTSKAFSIGSKITQAEAYTAAETLIGVDLDIADLNGMELEFKLHQNKPNPFTRATIIGFELPKASATTLTIYDMSGKIVKVRKGDYPKGYNQILLDGKAFQDKGMFYYQLATNAGLATKKMLLLK